MATWKSLELQIPGKDLLEPARGVLETLVVYLEILKALLDTLQAALIDFGNPIRALVMSLVKLIEELLLSLMVTGAHGYFDVPDTLNDPNFVAYRGGWPAFLTRFEASLADPRDYHRPQPRPGSTTSGFVLMVVESPDFGMMFAKLKALLDFFGKSFDMPRMLAPAHVDAFPLGSKKDPITALPQLFTDGPCKGVELRWSLPTTQSVATPGFENLVANTVSEIVPPAFLIERASVRPVKQVDASKNPGVKVVSSVSDAGEIDIDFMRSTDPGTVGAVTKLDSAEFRDPKKSSNLVLRRAPLLDNYGEPFIKFDRYYIVPALSLTTVAGALGTYRWIDNDTEEGKTYWYRIRAYRGSLTYNSDTKMLAFEQVKEVTQQGLKALYWPGTDLNMGHPSGIMEVKVPTTMDKNVFDVLGLVEKSFQLAYSLDFHAPQDYDGANAWSSAGYPAATTPVSAMGRGTLVSHAGKIAGYRAGPDLHLAGQDPTTILDLPITKTSVIKQSSKMAYVVTMAMMQQGTSGANQFKAMLQGAFPRPINEGEQEYTNLQDMIQKLTLVDGDGNASLETQNRLIKAYESLGVRANLQVVIEYFNSLALQGTPVNWVSVVPLRDIVPWCGQLVYDLLDKIEALLAGFTGVLSEISDLIDSLERKIQSLENLLLYLIRLLDFIESLQFDAYVLNVSGLSGSITDWTQTIRSAGGTPPNSSPAYLTSGVAFAYVATDPTAFQAAFKTIFGGG